MSNNVGVRSVVLILERFRATLLVSSQAPSPSREVDIPFRKGVAGNSWKIDANFGTVLSTYPLRNSWKRNLWNMEVLQVLFLTIVIWRPRWHLVLVACWQRGTPWPHWQLHHDMTYGGTSYKHRVNLLFRKASAAYDRQMLCFDFESLGTACRAL